MTNTPGQRGDTGIKFNFLVTGAAGFIGSTLSAALLGRDNKVHGIDNLSPYYDVRLKEARLARLDANPKFSFTLLDIAGRDRTAELFATHKFDAVVHLAAQTGVRYSMENPYAYGDAYLTGFLNIHAAGDGSYQTQIIQALQQHTAREDDVLADTLRRVLREEMAEYALAPRGRRKRAR